MRDSLQSIINMIVVPVQPPIGRSAPGGRYLLEPVSRLYRMGVLTYGGTLIIATQGNDQ